jgi:hypothetical protein
LTVSSLEQVWNSPRYVDMRKRLLENRLFPVCRRCCKVELSGSAHGSGLEAHGEPGIDTLEPDAPSIEP